MSNLWRYLRRVLPYLRPYWKLAAVSTLLTILLAGAGLLSPWPMKILVDSVLGDQPLMPLLARPLGELAQTPYALLGFVVLAGLGIELLVNLLSVLNSYVHSKLEVGMTLDFRGDLFQHSQRLSLAFHNQQRAGMMIYIVNFVAGAPITLVTSLLPLAQNILTLVGMLWISLQIDWQLALVSLTVVPFLYYSVGYYATHIRERLTQVKTMEGETLSILHEAMAMLRVIMAFGREDYEFRRFRTQGESANDARVKLTVRQTAFSLAVNTTTAVGTALVLGTGGYHALQGRLTVGELLIVLAYISSIYGPLQSVSSTIGSLQDQFVNLQMAFNLLDTQPDVKDRPGAVPIERARGRITFEQVCFNYPERRHTLEDISFEADVGQAVAIVGPTGAGKTTLVSLIPRFYDISGGRILLDGTDICKYTLKSLRHQVSIVLQEPLLFSGTIADNIQYGRLEATMSEVVEAAKAANIHDFIESLPEKYETRLGERGAQLSAGERQRISIARAFLKNAPMLILDEPTSSIDSRTELVILDALERLMAGRTTFMVAHRLSTIRNADLILVINQGRLVEQGTGDELLQAGGYYRTMHDLQSGQGGRATAPAVHALTDFKG